MHLGVQKAAGEQKFWQSIVQASCSSIEQARLVPPFIFFMSA